MTPAEFTIVIGFLAAVALAEFVYIHRLILKQVPLVIADYLEAHVRGYHPDPPPARVAKLDPARAAMEEMFGEGYMPDDEWVLVPTASQLFTVEHNPRTGTVRLLCPTSPEQEPVYLDKLALTNLRRFRDDFAVVLDEAEAILLGPKSVWQRIRGT